MRLFPKRLFPESGKISFATRKPLIQAELCHKKRLFPDGLFLESEKVCNISVSYSFSLFLLFSPIGGERAEKFLGFSDSPPRAGKKRKVKIAGGRA